MTEAALRRGRFQPLTYQFTQNRHLATLRRQLVGHETLQGISRRIAVNLDARLLRRTVAAMLDQASAQVSGASCMPPQCACATLDHTLQRCRRRELVGVGAAAAAGAVSLKQGRHTP